MARQDGKERRDPAWFELMMANQEDLAQILTAEQGKPLAEVARRDRLRRLVHRMVRRGGRAYGDIIPQHQANASW